NPRHLVVLEALGTLDLQLEVGLLEIELVSDTLDRLVVEEPDADPHRTSFIQLPSEAAPEGDRPPISREHLTQVATCSRTRSSWARRSLPDRYGASSGRTWPQSRRISPSAAMYSSLNRRRAR